MPGKVGDSLISDEELAFFNQTVDSLDESLDKLKDYYEKNQPEKFNELKKMMVSISKKISNRLK